LLDFILNIFIGVEVLTSVVLLNPWEQLVEVWWCKSGLFGGYGRISQRLEVKHFAVVTILESEHANVS